MTAPRTYAVGDRVLVGTPKIRAELGVVGMVVEVRQGPLPYQVDFGPPWTPAWWSGLDMEPAPDPWVEVAAAAAIATSNADPGALATVEIDFAALARGHQDADRRAAHDRTVAEATRVELARAWAEEQARPVVAKVPSMPVDLFGPGWRERDPMRKAGPR